MIALTKTRRFASFVAVLAAIMFLAADAAMAAEGASDRPDPPKAGPGLKPSVKVTGGGMYLNLKCKLIRTDGRKYSSRKRPPAPTFTVFKDGRKIGSGTFRYG